jgi:hypothetical protein
MPSCSEFFREPHAPEAQFPGMNLLGSSVNKDREEGEAPLLARQLPSGNGEGEVTPLLMDGGCAREVSTKSEFQNILDNWVILYHQYLGHLGPPVAAQP